MICDLQDLVAGEFSRERFRVLEGFRGLHLKFRTNTLLDDFVEGRLAVSRLPKDGCGLVQREQGRVTGRHNHHFAIETARGNARISGFMPSTARAQQLSGDLYAVNDDANPDAIVPKPVSVQLEAGRFGYAFPSRSITVIELTR